MIMLQALVILIIFRCVAHLYFINSIQLLSTPNRNLIFIELLPPPAGDNVHSFISNKVISNVPRWRGPYVQL